MDHGIAHRCLSNTIDVVILVVDTAVLDEKEVAVVEVLGAGLAVGVVLVADNNTAVLDDEEEVAVVVVVVVADYALADNLVDNVVVLTVAGDMVFAVDDLVVADDALR